MSQKRVVIILADGFEEAEAVIPADVLKRLGCAVTLVGLNDTVITGAHGIRILADSLLADSDAGNADAVMLPGGLPGATNLRDSALVTEILRERNASGKICAAICAAPAALEHAGIVNGRRITGYPGCERLSGNNALVFSGAKAERTENLVTGKGPGAAFHFAAALAESLGFPESDLNRLFDGMFVQL